MKSLPRCSTAISQNLQNIEQITICALWYLHMSKIRVLVCCQHDGLGCGHCFEIRSTVDLCRICVLSLHREVLFIHNKDSVREKSFIFHNGMSKQGKNTQSIEIFQLLLIKTFYHKSMVHSAPWYYSWNDIEFRAEWFDMVVIFFSNSIFWYCVIWYSGLLKSAPITWWPILVFSLKAAGDCP